MPAMVAAIDCGTTAVKAGLFDEDGLVIGSARRECPCRYEPDGGVWQDPHCLVESALEAMREAVERAAVRPADVASLSVSTQRATLICLDAGGRPLADAISWQDMRGAARMERFAERVSPGDYYQLTGLPLDPVFTLGKLLWLRHSAPELSAASRYAMVADWLLAELGCEEACLDLSNASLTGLLDIERLTWSDPILEAGEIARERPPELVTSATPVGRLSRAAADACGLAAGTPLVAGGGDQQCAGVGAGATAEGVVEITLGTAGVSLTFAPEPLRDPRRRVSCCVHAVPGAWELEGLQNSAGDSLRWVEELLGIENTALASELLEGADAAGPGAGGLLYLPFLAGSAAPDWIPRATGMLIGLRRSHDRTAVLRAVMEGVSMQTRAVLEVFAELGLPVEQLRLTGGYTGISIWNRIQAGVFGRPLHTLAEPQASLLGAAALAAVGAGIHRSVSQAAAAMVRTGERWEAPASVVAEYDGIYARYRAALSALRNGRLFETLDV